MKTLCALTLAMTLTAVAVLSSCTMSMNSDGSKDVTIDAKAAAAVIKVIAEK